MDIEAIKSRIRKLMAYAGDGAACEGEIENAMRHAAKLMDEHHINLDDIGTEQDQKGETMGRTFAVSTTTKFSTWESALANAVVELFGCVGMYRTSQVDPIRINGIAVADSKGSVKRGVRVCFYGPELEASEAASLFEEWSRSVATMGVARWGGCYKGDGAMYCYGFCCELLKKAKAINTARIGTQARPLLGTSAATTGAITLAKRYDLLKDAGVDWLKEEHQVTLTKGGSRSGYRAGGSDALNEGREHGRKAEFGRAPKRKMIGA